ncbi:hypothetical protein HPB48_024377 [Haemaphysalis longicornis]|uniref:Uncharacterized protein n=1 Tax=Haemaphysalis longicornis TaxID=44386 RepID=A0A9J6H7K7_HAELO|nr:hypothetical protein HPB48_024377 [Haemaphysalis longicornis]
MSRRSLDLTNGPYVIPRQAREPRCGCEALSHALRGSRAAASVHAFVRYTARRGLRAHLLTSAHRYSPARAIRFFAGDYFSLHRLNFRHGALLHRVRPEPTRSSPPASSSPLGLAESRRGPTEKFKQFGKWTTPRKKSGISVFLRKSGVD